MAPALSSVIVHLMRVLGYVLFGVLLCWPIQRLMAQQPSPADQLAQAQAMVSTLYRQLNTAIQDGAQQEAARLKAQQEVERLKAQLAEVQKKIPADGKAPEPVSQKDNY